MQKSHSSEISAGKRFDFGGNWTRFLELLSEDRILEAEASLKNRLGVSTLQGRRFLDIGSGSGLFSLAARRLGAEVYSFDYDPQSVACSRELRDRFFPNDIWWVVSEGSVLDREFLHRLGVFDIVYSWGVLHHTGQMWQALENVKGTVDVGGKLFIAIYNDQAWISRYWLLVKRAYVSNVVLGKVILVFHLPYLYLLRHLVRALTGRRQLPRGMSIWYDMIDWIGGYPFEFAKPEVIFEFFRNSGFSLFGLATCGGRHGCNEFVFERNSPELALAALPKQLV